jgi:hypothetical protein
MAFGIATNTGGDSEDFLPLLTYNAKAGRMKLTQRVEGANGWESQEEDVSFKQPAFVMDLAEAKVGWLFFKAGMAPIKNLVPIGQPLPPCPAGDFGVDQQGKAMRPKQGFSLRVLDGKRVLREFSANAGCVIQSVSDLHDKFLAAPEAAQDMLPVVKFAGTDEQKTKHGSNYAPVWEILKWVPRASMPEFGPRTVPPPAARQAAPAQAAPAAKGGGSAADDLADSIPFAPEWR